MANKSASNKIDKHKIKHQLYHASISLVTIVISMFYVHSTNSWKNVGKLSESWITPIIFCGEISKLLLARYFTRNQKDLLTGISSSATTSQRHKKNQISQKISDLIQAAFLQALCIAFYAFLCILFGAPVLNSYDQTFMLAVLLCLLTVSPTVFLLGIEGTVFVAFCEKVDFLNKIEESCLELIKYNAIGAIFGAWIGTAAAPLDWDREWQVYPIPNVIGVLLGCGIANIFACTKILITIGKIYLHKKR